VSTTPDKDAFEAKYGLEMDNSVVADELRMQKDRVTEFTRPPHEFELVGTGTNPKRYDVLRTVVRATGTPYNHVKMFMGLKRSGWCVIGLGTTLYTKEAGEKSQQSYDERFKDE
jgi:hypothetical protein